MKRGDIARIVAHPRSFPPGSGWAGLDVTVTSYEGSHPHTHRPGTEQVVGVMRGDPIGWGSARRATDRAHVYVSDLVLTGEVNEALASSKFAAVVKIPEPEGFDDYRVLRGLFDTQEAAWAWVEKNWPDMPRGTSIGVSEVFPPC